MTEKCCNRQSRTCLGEHEALHVARDYVLLILEFARERLLGTVNEIHRDPTLP